MKGKKIAVVQLGPSTRIASARVGEYIAHKLECELIYNDADWKYKKYDALIVVGFSPAFVKMDRDLVGKMVEKCGTYIIAVNDYWTQSEQMTQIRRACEKRGWSNKTRPPHMVPPFVWTTVQDYVKKSGDFYVNWNLIVGDHGTPLLRDPLPLRISYPEKLVYWGAYRLGRIKQFQKYLPNAVISCGSQKSFRKFQALLGDQNLTYAPPFNSLRTLHEYGGCTVYIEDEVAQSKLFCSLATRFYEALHIGMPILISEESAANVRKAGLDPDKYVVRGPADIKKLPPVFLKDIAKRQRHDWLSDFRAELDKQFMTPMRWLKKEIA